jgi:3-methyladenine DNA glycosylase AlkD
LFANSDLKYKEFSEKIANTKKTFIGVRIPKLRQIANELFKDDYNAFLNGCKFDYFEDTLLYGLIVAKLPYEQFIKLLPTYLNNCDSWSHIDSFVSSIKCIKKSKDVFLKLIKENINNAQGFYLRFYVVCLMTYYVEEQNLDYIFSICQQCDGRGYYNDMAIAWLISVLFVKFKEQSFEFLKTCNLSTFTLNKAISKICDSFRVTLESKTLLKKFYRKK